MARVFDNQQQQNAQLDNSRFGNLYPGKIFYEPAADFSGQSDIAGLAAKIYFNNRADYNKFDRRPTYERWLNDKINEIRIKL